MEARNILWGELVGGLLVVGCSVALVISLWQHLGGNPLFKFCAFTGAVGFLFSAGLYTLRRWRLESTSRGLLLTATLLAPVNVLALALPAPNASPLLALTAQVATLAVLAALVWRAGRVFTPDSPVLLAAALVGTSACQVALARFIRPDLPGPTFLTLGLLPVACNLLTTGALLVRIARRGPLDRRSALGLLLFLGTAEFALLVTLALGVVLGGDPATALGWLALPIALAGTAPLAVGAHIHHSLGDRQAAGPRTAGTAVALAGMVVMLLAAALAWPRPLPLLAVCALDFVALTAIAFRYGLPAAHILALPCLTGACLSATFLAAGAPLSTPDAELPSLLLAHVLAPPTAMLLLALALPCGLFSEVLARRAAPAHGLAYALGAGGLLLLGVALATPYGLAPTPHAEPGRALLVYALAGTGILALNARWRRAEATYLGLALLVAATLWGLWRVLGAVTPEWGPVLALLGLALALAGWTAGRINRPGSAEEDWLAGPLGQVSNLVAAGAAGVAGWSGALAWSQGSSVWALAHVATGALLSALCTARALAGGGALPARLGAWLLLGTLCLAAGRADAHWRLDNLEVVLANTLALGGLALASLGLLSARRARVLSAAWSETALGAGVLALALMACTHDQPGHTLTLAAVTATAFVLAWGWGSAVCAWFGSALVLAGLAHGLLWGLAHPAAHPLLLAVLTHSTLVLLAALALDHLARRARRTRRPHEEDFGEGDNLHEEADRLCRVFVEPLRLSGLASSALAVPLLAAGLAGPLAPLACLAVWLAGLWLALAWVGRLPALFAAFQAALTGSVVLGVAAVLQAQGHDLASPASFRLYGVALAVLGVLWAGARLGLRPGGRTAELVAGSWPGVDHLVLALLVPAQLAFAVLAILPGVVEELTPVGRAVTLPAELAAWAGQWAGWPGWALVGLLALALVVESRGKPGREVLLGLLALALTVPVLLAGTFEKQGAEASALRWGLAGCLVVCSLPLWLRDRLAVRAARLGLGWDARYDLATLARRVLVAGTVGPVLALALVVALAGLARQPVRGPGPDSIFAAMGRLYSAVVPLGVVCAVLVVHALRERLPGYAFAVGLGGNLLATLVLRAHHRGEPLVDWWVPLAQGNALAFAGTALLWLVARRRLYGPAGAGALLTVQVMLGLLANAALLAAGVAPLIAVPSTAGAALPALGTPLGWLALAVAGVAGVWYACALWRDLLPHLTAGLVWAAVILLAHAAGAAGPPWLAYHLLMVGWALVGMVLLVAPRSPLRAWLHVWVPALAVLVAGVALREAAFGAPSPWWSAGGVLAGGALLAGLALAQRREDWALAAAGCLEGALALVLCHAWGGTVGEWVRLVQAESIVASIAAGLWLAASPRLYGAARPRPERAPLLALQLGLLLLCNVLLLGAPALLLIAFPGTLPAGIAEVGGARGWLALVSALGVWGWYLGRALPRGGVHVAGALGMALAVLAACTSARWAEADPWLPQRVLTGGLAVLAAGLLAAGWVASRAQPRAGAAESTSPLWVVAFDPLAVQAWVAGLVLAVVGLALREEGPWSWALALGWAVLLSAGLALWRRREHWAFVAGLYLTVAVVLVQWHRHEYAALAEWWVVLFQSVAVTVALVALVWLSALRLLTGTGRPSLLASPLLAFQVALGLLANVVLLAHPAAALLAQPGDLPPEVAQAGGVGGWLAFLAALAPAGWYAGRALRRGGVVLLTALGLAVSALAGCTAAALAGHPAIDPWLAYHVLLAGCALTGAITLASTWRRLPAPRAGLPGMVCVAGVGGAVLGLGLRGVGFDPLEPWAPAGAVLTSAALAAGLALGRRSQQWAFVSALGLELAASLIVEHGHRGTALDDWWVLLVQVNTVLAALIALAWLAARRRLEAQGEESGEAVLVGVQVALPVLGNIALLAGPLGLLLADPGAPPAAVAQAGHAAGWLALLLAGLAAGWYARALLAAAAAHLPGVLGLAVGVLAACTAARWDAGGWLAYHVLTACWSALGLGLLALAWRAGVVGQELDVSPRPAQPQTTWTSLDLWAAVVGALVLALALRGVGADPAGPWWSAGAVVAVSVLAGGLALRLRDERWALAAATGINLALGLVLAFFDSWEQALAGWLDLVRAHVLACAGCVAAWQAACRRLYGTAVPAPRQAPLLHLLLGLTLAGVAAALLEPALRLVIDPGALHPHIVQASGVLGWLAVLATVAVTAWQVRARPASVFGLTAIGVSTAILAGCTAARWDSGNWLAYHVFMAALAVVGFAVLAHSRAPLRLAGRAHVRTRSGPAGGARIAVWSANGVLGAQAALVAGLALRGMAGDPAGAWWPVGVVLAVGLQAAVAAVWLRSESWAFVATLAADLAVSFIVWDANRTGSDEALWIQLLQANILSGSLASLLWVAINYRVYVDRPPGLRGAPLLSVQALLGLAGNAVLLGQPAFLGIIWTPGALPPGVVAADGVAGWATLVLTAVVALVQLRITRMEGAAQVLGSLGLAAGVLLACTAAHWDRGDWLTYHTLTASWGALAVVMLLAGRVRGPRRGEEEEAKPGALLSDRLVREWVVLAGVPVLLLALRGVLEDPAGPWWSAGAVLGVGLLLALVGTWQRRPGWVFVGGLGANLAISLVLWRLHAAAPVSLWWRELLQANVAAFGLVGLLWLSATRHERSGLLERQVLLGLAGNAVLLAWPAWLLVGNPDFSDPLLTSTSSALGWLAVTLAGAAALWHAVRAGTGRVVPVAVALLLATLVLAACSVARLHPGDWLPYHVLLVGATLAALVLLSAGWLRTARLEREDSLFPARDVHAWSVLLGALALGLAWRGGLSDPQGPWWSAGAMLATALLAALLGAWQRREGWALVAGLCLNMAGSLVLWRAHRGEPLAEWWVRLVQVNLAASSAAALAWLAAGSRFYEPIVWQKRSVPLRGLQSLIGLAGNAVLLVPPAVLLIREPANPAPAVAQAGGLAGWLTLALALLAAGCGTLGPSLLRLGVPLLCAAGLTGGVLLACTVAAGAQTIWAAYHVLMASCGLTGLAALAGAREAARRALRQERPTLPPAVAQGCVLALAVLGLGLASRAAFQDPTGPWWPAGAVLTVGATLAGLASWRRQEGWAFAAGLCVNLAVSLVLVSFHLTEPFEAWGLLLAQANLLVGAATALLWLLGTRGWNGRPHDHSSLRTLQVALVLAGNAALLAHALAWLALLPGAPVSVVSATGSAWGWLALLGALAVAAWQWGNDLPLPSALAAGALALGALASCSAAAWDGGNWLSWHVLIVAAGLTGAALLVGQAAVPVLDAAGQAALSVSRWVAVLALLVAGMGLRGVLEDPGRPWWPAGAVLGGSALCAGLALWRRRAGWALVASAGVDLACSVLLWDARRADALADWWLPLLQVNLGATAATALLWLALVRRLHDEEKDLRTLCLLDIQLGALLAGVAGVLVPAGVALVAEPGGPAPLAAEAVRPWGWAALVLALAAGLWRWSLAGRPGRPALAGVLALTLPVVGACAAESGDGWLAYRVLAFGWGAAGLALAGWGWKGIKERAGILEAWSALLAALTLGLTLRSAGEDPAGPWWSAGGALCAGAVGAVLALWRRRESWALAAGLCGNLAASLVLWHAWRELPLSDWWVPLVQVNVIASALAACAWLALGRRLGGTDQSTPLRTVQVALGLLGNVALLLGPTVWLVAEPATAHPELIQVGTYLGWLALLAALAAAVWHAGRTLAAGGIHVLCGLGLALGVLLAASAAHVHPRWQAWSAQGGWLAYHVLLAAWAALGAATLTLGWALTGEISEGEGQDRGEVARAWVAGLLLAVVALALRGFPEDPTGPWWSAGGLLATGLLAGGLAVWGRAQAFVYSSGLLLTAAGLAATRGWGLGQPADRVWMGLLGLAGSGVGWTLLEGSLRRRTPPVDLRGGVVPPFGHAASALVPLSLLVLAGLDLAWALGVPVVPVASPLTWPALTAGAALLVVCLADPSARLAPAGLYCIGLAALGLAVGEMPRERWWLAGPALAAFVTVAAGAREWGSLLPAARAGRWPAGWFLPAQGLLGVLVAGLSLWLCLGMPALGGRGGGPLALGLLLPGVLLLARERTGAGGVARHAVLLLVALACAESGWVWLGPVGPAPWLERTALLLAALAVLTLAYGIGLARVTTPESGWPAAGRLCGAALGVAAGLLLGGVLAQEVVLTLHGVRPLMGPGVTVAVALALVLLMVAGVAFALRADLDPLGLSERGRTGYVYGVELLLVALFAHVRLSAPEWFSGRLQGYWPFVVFAIAFAGAGLSEAFTRLGLRVLAEPLGRTGVLLPVVPVVAFWAKPAGDYATLWFVAGTFYGLLAVVRRNLGFALLGALAANVGLWVVLHENQMAFLRYPQLWLVPFALTALVAGHLNRDRLGRAQTTALRYASLTVIYVASTAETFLTGLGQDVTRPLVLVGLALLGMFAGMLLRVRAFLFLGVGFVGLGVLALVWHAAESRSWLWYVAGIVLGVALIVLFAVFEKRRNDILRLVERLREWD
jgi:hypothetical protein